MRDVSKWSIMWGGLLLAGIAFIIAQSYSHYKSNLVPDVVDPCSPDAPAALRDTQDSHWPVHSRREDVCGPDKGDQEEDESE